MNENLWTVHVVDGGCFVLCSACVCAYYICQNEINRDKGMQNDKDVDKRDRMFQPIWIKRY